MQSTQPIAAVRQSRSILATGAAAVFVANLDSESLPESTYAVADILAHTLNELPEDTLRDALELIRPTVDTAKSGEVKES